MSILETKSVSGFERFELCREIQRGIEAIGFTEPRPIQAEAIPEALRGRDVLGLAQTGTGKTAAFALPILERLLRNRKRVSGPRALILAPTRELANQISAEIEQLAKFTRIGTAVIIGGVSIHSQLARLRAKPEIMVACPGRLLDLMGQGHVRLNHVETLVLDEADHMFDMGFLPDIRRILAELPRERQNLMFSATMPREIRGLAKGVLSRPHTVELSHRKPLETIEHTLYPIDEKQKVGLLRRVLSEDQFVSAIVFTRTKHRAKRLALKLAEFGHRAIALQGNMSQNARVRAMDGFRKREYDVLVATDIAARGIDVEQVSHVVNFDMPNTAEAYTHRIGRTGRAEREGRAYTFITDADQAQVRAVEQRMGMSIPRRKVNGIESIALPTGRMVHAARRSSENSNRRGRPSRPRRQQTSNEGGAATGGRRRRTRRPVVSRAS